MSKFNVGDKVTIKGQFGSPDIQGTVIKVVQELGRGDYPGHEKVYTKYGVEYSVVHKEVRHDIFEESLSE